MFKNQLLLHVELRLNNVLVNQLVVHSMFYKMLYLSLNNVSFKLIKHITVTQFVHHQSVSVKYYNKKEQNEYINIVIHFHRIEKKTLMFFYAMSRDSEVVFLGRQHVCI